jgi:hypothetical protein
MSEEMKNGEVCPDCGKVHPQVEHLGIKVSKEDVDKLRMILSKSQSARSAMNPNSIEKDVNPEKLKQYFSILNSILADCMNEESEWWNGAIETYDLPKNKNVSLDNKFEEFIIVK